jgi:hypothetical protein
LAIVLPSLGRAQEQPPNQAGLVIQHGDGRVVTACVSFGEPEINGQDLLDRAGVGYIAQSSGANAAVCKLDGEGCDYPAEDCFCKCRGAECVYWAYQSLRDGKWSYGQVGAPMSRVRPGDVQGWAWGSGSVQAGAQPPVLSLDQICAAPAAAQPTEAPPPTDAPAPIEPSPAPPTEAPPPTPPPTRAPATAQPTAPPSTTSAATAPPTAVAVGPTEAPTRAPTARPPSAPPATAGAAPPTEAAAPTATLGAAGVAAPTPAAPAEDRSPVGYLAFAAIALALLSGIAAALLRRRAR